jgi:hypothetical protein
MALREFRKKMPTGDMGRIINSFIFDSHKDSIEYQRKFRIKVHKDSEKFRKEEGIVFYQSMSLKDCGWMFRIDCAMCEEPLYLYMEYEYSYNKIMKGACVWIRDEAGHNVPIGTMIIINEGIEQPEILPEGIITPCCDQCLKRYSFDRL